MSFPRNIFATKFPPGRNKWVAKLRAYINQYELSCEKVNTKYEFNSMHLEGKKKRKG